MTNDNWQKRAASCLAKSGALTFSKSHQYYTENVPVFVREGHGQHLIDTTGRMIFDCGSGLGSNLLECRNNLSLPTVLEVSTAEELLHRIQFCDDARVQFVKSGTEACMAACRWMRAATGSKGIYKLGYSGWSTEMIAAEEPGIGCGPTDVKKFETIKDLITAVEKSEELAGVILEPVQLDEDVVDGLRLLRRTCTRRGCLLTYDETITGMRYLQYTVAQTYDIHPDLLVMGKALGGGYPLGVVIGPKQIMDIPGVFVSGTFCGEPSALEWASKTLAKVSPDVLKLAWDQSHDFQSKLNWACHPRVSWEGYGMRMVMKDGDGGITKAKMSQELFDRHKILMGPLVSIFPKLTWGSKEYGMLLAAVQSVMQNIDKVELKGRLPQPVFKR